MTNHSRKIAKEKSKTKISVILCTHNPNIAILEETLNHLYLQNLNKKEWELLIIDNASSKPLKTQIDISSQKEAKIVEEKKLGLTNARLCGFNHAKSDLLVLVDDDNLLNFNYLKSCLEIANNYPEIGAFGGSIQGVFKEEPPKWIQHDLIYLAVREINEISIAKETEKNFNIPAGAGMCIRKTVCDHYQKLLKKNPFRKKLDRQGQGLVSSGDTDLACCAWDIGMQIGNFPQLRCQHIIPAKRMTRRYMARLHEGMAFSETLLKYLRYQEKPKMPSLWRKFKTTCRYLIERNPKRIHLYAAHLNGIKRAKKTWKQWSC